MKRWISFLFLLLLLPYQALAAGYSTSIGDSDIMISGQKTISYRYAFAMGNKNIFRTDNMVSLGGTIDEQSTFLTINGKVPDKFSITGNLSDGTYMGSQASIEVKAKNVGLYLGDIAANLTGSEFGSFNKNLNGIKVEGDWGKSKFTLITSQLESQSKTEIFQGKGIMGPYRLEYGYDIIEGTETVKVDGKVQVRRQDYRIEQGNLYFTNKFVYSYNTIEVSYEYSLFFNLNPGTLSGFRGTTSIGEKLQLGTTVFRQTANSFASGAIFYGIDTFSGAEFKELKNQDNSYTFQVQYWPIMDSNDYVVTVYIYTEDDDKNPAKSWASHKSKWDTQPFEYNVDVEPAYGTVTLKQLLGYEETDITKVEVHYNYLISFPEIYKGDKLAEDGRYVKYSLSENQRMQQYLVSGKAYLEYIVDNETRSLQLSAQDFEYDPLANTVSIDLSIFEGLSSGSIPDKIELTLYYTLPPAKEGEDNYRADRTVIALDGRAQLTPRIALQGEVGFSKGHLSADDLYHTKTLRAEQLAGKLVQTEGGALLLYLNRFALSDYFPLPIEPMTETITTRRNTGTTSTFIRGKDYEIDFFTGVITFLSSGEVGILDPNLESITIRYKYLDEDAIINEGDPVVGLGAKLGATANFDKVSFNINWRSLGKDFSPLGMSRTSSYGNKELSRLSTGLTLRPTSYLQLSSNFNHSLNSHLVKEELQTVERETLSNNISNEARLNVPGWPSLIFSNHQNVDPSSKRTNNTISTNYNVGIFSISGSVGATDFFHDPEDKSLSYSQHNQRRNFSLDARPSAKFNTGYSFTNSVQLGTQANTKNSTDNAHNLSMEFKPSNKLSLRGSYNIQFLSQLDSDEKKNIQRGTLNFTNTLSPKVTLRGDFSRTMDPGSYQVGYTMDYGRLNWDYNFTRYLTFSSSLNLSSTNYDNGSYSRNRSIQGDIRYTPQIPALQRKRVRFTWSNSYRPQEYLSKTSANPTDTKTQTATSKLSVSFDPLTGLSFETSYELQYNRSNNSTQDINPITNTFSADGTYRLSNKVQARGNLRFSDNARNWSSNYATLGSSYGNKLEGTIGVNYTISPSARVNVDWKLIGYQDGKQHMKDANYFGNVITTKLVGTF